MKKSIIVWVIPAIVAAFVSCGTVFPILGNGHLVTSGRNISSFERISISGSAEVRFHASNEYRTVISVDSNLEEFTRVYTRGDLLVVGTRIGNYSFTKYLVDVYCPTLSGVSISGSGRFSGDDTIITSTFDINISGSGRIMGTIESDNFSADISGSGKLSIAGVSKDSDISISGSGNFEGNEFSVNNATVRISGSGKVSICVTDNLRANISGSGELNYRGDPKLDSSITGSGRIRKR